jgi:hypothetical protein
VHPPVSRDGSQLIEWNRRARHIVVREVIACRVMSGPIESSDDECLRGSRRPLAIRTHVSGSDHAVDDEDGSDSEVSMRCELIGTDIGQTPGTLLHSHLMRLKTGRLGRFLKKTQSIQNNKLKVLSC